MPSLAGLSLRTGCLTGWHGHRDWLIALLIYRHTRRLQHYLGHASITNTVRYTAMSPEPFKVIW